MDTCPEGAGSCSLWREPQDSECRKDASPEGATQALEGSLDSRFRGNDRSASSDDPSQSETSSNHTARTVVVGMSLKGESLTSLLRSDGALQKEQISTVSWSPLMWTRSRRKWKPSEERLFCPYERMSKLQGDGEWAASQWILNGREKCAAGCLQTSCFGL